MRRAHACLCAALLAHAALAALATPARAGGSFADREAARALSEKAYEQFEGKHYRRAIELFQQAEARFHAPPHLLYTARAQFKLGLFVEAKATFERAVAEKLPADAPAPFREAQTSARAELAEVEALTPRLFVTLPEPPPPGARVFLDGEPLAAADLGRPLPRNPGTHALVAEAPGTPKIERNVVLTAGGGDERVELSPAPPAVSPSVVPVAVAFSVGAAGLVAGTAGALLLLGAPAVADHRAPRDRGRRLHGRRPRRRGGHRPRRAPRAGGAGHSDRIVDVGARAGRRGPWFGEPRRRVLSVRNPAG